MLFPCLTVVILFILFMSSRIKSSDRKTREETSRFWENERRANATRKQPLDSIPFICIPLDRLPFLESPDDDILACQNKIKQLADEKIACLYSKTNTELKLSYGAANLELLSAYDQNYIELVRTLYQWGRSLYQAGYNTEAKSVLEFGVSCQTDISKHYTLLAEIYKQEKTPHKIEDLLAAAEQLDGLMKPSIIRSLHAVMDSCHATEESR